MIFLSSKLDFILQWKQRGPTHMFFEEYSLERSWSCIPQGVRPPIQKILPCRDCGFTILVVAMKLVTLGSSLKIQTELDSCWIMELHRHHLHGIQAKLRWFTTPLLRIHTSIILAWRLGCAHIIELDFTGPSSLHNFQT